jgi:hypothetical protein
MQQWIRVIKPNGTEHIVPASNRDFYLKHNAALLMGSNPRKDLLLTIETLSPAENAAENNKILIEADNQSQKSKKLRQAAYAANVAQNGGGGMSNDTIAELIKQNSELMNQIKELSNGQKTRKTTASV